MGRKLYILAMASCVMAVVGALVSGALEWSRPAGRFPFLQLSQAMTFAFLGAVFRNARRQR
jgi:hypothetical protein